MLQTSANAAMTMADRGSRVSAVVWRAWKRSDFTVCDRITNIVIYVADKVQASTTSCLAQTEALKSQLVESLEKMELPVTGSLT
ncbi:hypothetical protein J6590_014242 [Homalodisca vitripennis]|nr:hypothetical protein J6590_014242 [Homalodisca vitripennis]